MSDQPQNRQQDAAPHDRPSLNGQQLSAAVNTQGPQIFTKRASTDKMLLPSLSSLGLKTELLADLVATEAKAIDETASKYIQERAGIDSALRAAKAAAAHVKMVRRTFEQAEKSMVDESAVILEAARSTAELQGAPIATPIAIQAAIKIARTSRQRLGLLLRLRDHEKKQNERINAGSI